MSVLLSFILGAYAARTVCNMSDTQVESFKAKYNNLWFVAAPIVITIDSVKATVNKLTGTAANSDKKDSE